MAKQFESREQINTEMVALGKFLEEHFGLTDCEVDQVLYRALYTSVPAETVEDVLVYLCGDPSYRNYN